MVLTHVESDQNSLHISYYETDHHKEGIIELTLTNPADFSKVHLDDTVDIDNIEDFFPGKPCTVTLHHMDDTTDQIDANYACMKT